MGTLGATTRMFTVGVEVVLRMGMITRGARGSGVL